MTLEQFTDEIRNRIGTNSGIDATVKLDTDQGVVYIDGKQVPNVISNEDKDADCVLQVTIADLQKMASGELNPMSAFMFGKLKVKGDMGVAMKMGQKLA